MNEQCHLHPLSHRYSTHYDAGFKQNAQFQSKNNRNESENKETELTMLEVNKFFTNYTIV